jgi:hypothetical protein
MYLVFLVFVESNAVIFKSKEPDVHITMPVPQALEMPNSQDRTAAGGSRSPQDSTSGRTSNSFNTTAATVVRRTLPVAADTKKETVQTLPVAVDTKNETVVDDNNGRVETTNLSISKAVVPPPTATDTNIGSGENQRSVCAGALGSLDF